MRQELGFPSSVILLSFSSYAMGVGDAKPPHPRQSRDLSPKRGEVFVGLSLLPTNLFLLLSSANPYLAPFRGEVAANGRG
jgi:hypothetical protein